MSDIYAIELPIPDDDIMYLARTIFGEARGESIITQLLVGFVIKNRKDTRGFGGDTYRDVVLQPYQFSCWLEDDPNREKVERPWEADERAWQIAKAVAWAVDNEPGHKNPIPGVLHYVDTSIADNLPGWARSMRAIRYPLVPRIIFLKEE